MRFFSRIVFILLNIYLIESADRTESENSEAGFQSEKSEDVRKGAEEKSDNLEEVLYEDYEYDDGSRENFVLGKSEKANENSTEVVNPADGFPNEVFLSLRNITADAATAFKSFHSRNDVVDLQASASDNLNVTTTNNTYGDAESAGINLRALRDAGHPPQITDEAVEAVHLPYKHTKIDTADLSDCALQGEWKPMGVAHGHLHVGDDNPQHTEILQSVGSYAVPNKVIPHWQQNLRGGGQNVQDSAYNHKPSGLYAGGTGGNGYGANYGYGSGFVESNVGGVNGGMHYALNHYHGSGGFSGGGVNQFQKIKSASMLSPPPIPPIILGKKPGYWKLPKSKHKFFPGKGRRPGFSGGGVYGFSSHVHHVGGAGHSGAVLSSHSNYGANGLGGGGLAVPGISGHGIKNGVGGALISGGHAGHKYGGGAGESLSVSGGHGYGSGSGGLSVSGGSVNGYHGSEGGLSVSGSSSFGSSAGTGVSDDGGHRYGGGVEGSLSLSEGSSGLGQSSGIGSGPTSGHLIGGSEIHQSVASEHESVTGAEENLSSVGQLMNGYLDHVGGVKIPGSHLMSALGSGAGDKQSTLLLHNPGTTIPGGHLVSINHGGIGGGDSLMPEAAFLSTEIRKPSGGGNHYQDSTFSSTHITQGLGGENSLPDVSFLSSHINQDFAVHGKGVSDDLSSSSTFTCGKNHDHNTSYHTATFQVADHDHPSSVDVLQYGGDTVLIQSGHASFHDQVLPERKHYKASHLLDAEVSSTDNRNELTSQAAQLTSKPIEQDVGQTEVESTKLDDGEEPERHSYYHEITKVTKIPATSVGSVEYTFSKYETKPQTFSTETGKNQDEPEVEQPQIIRELENLSNKFQLDLENPQKLFEDPPSKELAYHYPFQNADHEDDKREDGKEENHESITEFPYQFYHNNANKVIQYPVINKKPIVKYIPRPGKPHFHQKTVSYQHKPPLVVLRKHKPKQFLQKQNYEVKEHSGERQRPIGEIFPPQKFPKQFHNPKPNFAVDRPKNGWRPDVYQEYKYDHSHGKKIKKFKTKAKLVAPILIRRPVSPAPVIRVVEVTG